MAADLVEDLVDLHDGRPPLRIARPASSEALLDERRFADEDEFLPYWAELWPSAVALARALAAPRGAPLADLRVLELGCGLGLPALAAARAGARVLATDWAPEAVRAVDENARRNGLCLEARTADWRDGEALRRSGPYDLILAADVLYETRHTEPLLTLLRALQAPRILLADPSRATAATFLDAVGTTHVRTTTTDPTRPALNLHELRPR